MWLGHQRKEFSFLKEVIHHKTGQFKGGYLFSNRVGEEVENRKQKITVFPIPIPDSNALVPHEFYIYIQI